MSKPLLLQPAPGGAIERLLLYAVRRMSVGGLDDAMAQAAFIGTFGLGYRRPLVLTRLLVTEIARAATQPVMLAPCCCPRVTAAEAAIAGAIAAEESEAHALLTQVTGTADCLAVASAAFALGEACRDLGRPVG